MYVGRNCTVNPETGVEVVERSADNVCKDDLRRAFLAFIDQDIDGAEAREARRFEWQAFIQRFAAEGIKLPADYRDFEGVLLATRVVRTGLEGHPVGWNFDHLIRVAHHLFDHHPRSLAVFGNLLREAGHNAILERQDADGEWKKKVDRLPALRTAHPNRFAPDLSMSDLLTFLFPASVAVIGRLERTCIAADPVDTQHV